MTTLAPILVCFAVPEEASPFRRQATGRNSVRVLVTGMGRRNAEAAIVAWFSEQPASLVLTCGFAGGLNPALTVGTVVYDVPEGSPLVGTLRMAGAVPVRFHGADRVAVTGVEKGRLRDQTGADAVEMESDAIRRICRERGVPAATVRVISDGAGEDLPLDFNRLVGPNWEMDYARLALAIARSPGRIPALLAFQKRVAAAAETLARVLVTVTSE